MWRDKFLNELEKSGYSSKQLAEKSGVSENTIKRIKKYSDVTIQLATLDQLAKGLGLELNDLTNDTNAVIGTVKLEVLQEQLNKAIDDNNILIAEKNLLEKEVSTLTSRLELSETKLLYCEKLLAVYEKFDKIKSI